MQNEIIKQSIGIFDSQDKWDALFEIHNHSEEIIGHWLTIGAHALRESFAEHPIWGCEIWGNAMDTRWYLKDDASKSLGIGFGWLEVEFHLHVYGSDTAKRMQAVTLLESREFKPLQELFELTTSQARHPEEGSVAYNLTINPFSGARDTQVRVRELAWLAAHKTDYYAEKMGGIIRRLTDDERMTELFRELNRQINKGTGTVTEQQ